MKLWKKLKNEYIPKCRKTYGISNLPNGEKMYRFCAKKHIGLKNITIKSIHNYGLKEIERIKNEMIITKNKMGFKGSLKEFNKYFLNRKDLKFKNREEVLTVYRNKLREINKTVIKDQFNTKISHTCVNSRL